MRPAREVPGIGTLRPCTLWRALLLSVATLGVYYLVLVYQNTRDIQSARTRPLRGWRVLFWLGALPFLGLLHAVLYLSNGLGFREFLARQGRRDDRVWLLAAVLALVPPVGQVLWAVTFDGWLRLTGAPVDADVRRTPAGASG